MTRKTIRLPNAKARILFVLSGPAATSLRDAVDVLGGEDDSGASRIG